MKLVLVINRGNATKQFSIYSAEGEKIIDAFAEKEEEDFNLCFFTNGIQRESKKFVRNFFEESLGEFILEAVNLDSKIDITKIENVLLKTTVAGSYFQENHVIDNKFLDELKAKEKVDVRAYHLSREINTIKKFLPSVKIVAISDSAFHKNIKQFIKNYSLPKTDLQKNDIQRFGFYGLATASVVKKLPAILGQDFKKIIVCNVGSGVCVTAVENGESKDTTMGFSFGDGLFSKNQAGDLDGGAVLALMQLKNLKISDTQTYLQTSGGLYGWSKETDLRIILDKSEKGDEEIKLGLKSFIYQIQKAIGGLVFGLGGVDAFVFTATAAERSPALRSMIMSGLTNFGFALDEEKNALFVSKDGKISSNNSLVDIVVIKNDEAREMLETYNEM